MSVKVNNKTNIAELLKPYEEDILLADKVKVSLEHALKLVKGNKFDSKTCIEYNEISKLWHCCNYKNNNSLIQILYGNFNFDDIIFVNNDMSDYRPCNIVIKPKHNNILPPSNYIILKYGEPVILEQGACAKESRNMYWKVEDENFETYYLMHIKDDIFTKISKRDINKVLNFNDKRPTWRLFQNGYVCCTININSTQKVYYLHQYIMNVHTEDLTSYEKTIDHINRDKLDNRQSNLRFANMSEQNSNRDKSARRCDAKTELPEWLEELPKYVQFRREVYNKDTGDVREFFIIQHPSLDKIWESSKSINVLTSDKFKATKLKLQLIENIITEKQYNKESGFNDIIDLPKYLVIICRNESKCFSYDYKNDTGDRYTQKIVIKSQDIQSELNKFIECLNTKYPDLKFPNYIIQNKKACSKLGSQIIVKDDIKSDIQIKIDNMKKELPPNFSIGNEKGTLYLSFSKNIDGKRHSMKRVMKSDNVKNELTNLIEELNCKYKLQFNI